MIPSQFGQLILLNIFLELMRYNAISFFKELNRIIKWDRVTEVKGGAHLHVCSAQRSPAFSIRMFPYGADDKRFWKKWFYLAKDSIKNHSILNRFTIQIRAIYKSAPQVTIFTRLTFSACWKVAGVDDCACKPCVDWPQRARDPDVSCCINRLG